VREKAGYLDKHKLWVALYAFKKLFYVFLYIYTHVHVCVCISVCVLHLW